MYLMNTTIKEQNDNGDKTEKILTRVAFKLNAVRVFNQIALQILLKFKTKRNIPVQ